MGLYACHQFPGTKGLHHIIIRPDAQTLDPVVFCALGSEHNDRNIGDFPDVFAYGLTIDIRKLEVQNDKVKSILDLAYGRFTGFHGNYVETFAFKIRLDDVGYFLLILDYKDSHISAFLNSLPFQSIYMAG